MAGKTVARFKRIQQFVLQSCVGPVKDAFGVGCGQPSAYDQREIEQQLSCDFAPDSNYRVA